MASLAIPPHTPGNSRLAVVVLVLVAAGSFANGVLRQSADVAPVVAAAAEAPVAPPVAAAQPILQLARAEPAPRSAARVTPVAAPPSPTADPVASALVSEPASAAEPVAAQGVAVEAVASAPDPAPALTSDAPPTP